MKIVVVGPGAIGCLFAGFFHASGHDVWMLDHNAQRTRVIAEKGLTIEDPSGSRTVNVNITCDVREVGRCDMVFFCVKSYDTEAAINNAVSVIDEATTVVSLQNGFGNVEIIEKAVGGERVVCAITAHGSTESEVGHVIHGGKGPTLVASLGSLERAETVKTFFEECGIEAKNVGDMSSMIWSKLVVNAAINPLTAVSDISNGKLLEDPVLREAMKKTAREAAFVARAAGVTLMYEDEVEEVESVCKATSGNISSMLQDIRMGRRTEIDYITGIIVNKARELGLDTPSNDILLESVKKLEQKV